MYRSQARAWFVSLSLCVVFGACGPEKKTDNKDANSSMEDGVAVDSVDDTSEVDGGVDAGDGSEESDGDTGMAGKFSGELDREVEVYEDSFGMKHIYANSLEDLFFMNGYQYATDRFGQMELFRRVATGTMSEVLGSLSSETLKTDIMMRTLGLKRSAKKFWKENYDPNKEAYIVVEAFCRGVNAYLEERRDGEVEESAPVDKLFPPDHTRDWEPSDVLAVGKLLAVQLTYIADPEIKVHGIREDILDTYKAGASDADKAARVGLLHDIIRFAPPTGTTHIDDFPDKGEALSVDSERPDVSPATIQNAVALHEGLTDIPFMDGNGIMADSRWSTGSNNWTLSGAVTASGHPNVANDPHLDLTLPSIFYPIHLELENDIDGREPISVVGGAILGVPGVVVGRTNKVAWGTTVGFYDYVDVYHEQISGTSKDSKPSTVKFEGKDVEVKEVTETIRVGSFGQFMPSKSVELNLEIVPHHGPILKNLDGNNRPKPRTSNEALSVKWVGLKANNEYEFLTRLYRAEKPSDVEKALDYYTVGSSNFVFGFTNGDIFYSGQSNIPIRSDGAMTFDPVQNPEGNAPTFILPGDGSAEWEGFVDEKKIPHAKNPQKGYIVTANNDQVGTTLDNDPFNDDEYLGSLYANGFRGKRITELVEDPSKVGDGDDKLSLEEQTTIQNDGKDLIAARVVPEMVEAINKVLDTNVSDSATPDMKATRDLVGNRSNGQKDLEKLRDLLEGWDYVTPGTRSPSGQDVDRSAAATLFNTAMVYLIRETYGDEFAAIGRYASGNFDIPFGSEIFPRILIWHLEQPKDAETYDSRAGDVLLFDDMSTDNVTETRIYQLVNAVLEANDRLASGKTLAQVFNRDIPSPESDDPKDWIWGKVHGLSLGAILPFGGEFYERPEMGLPFYPRPGGQNAVSPCNHNYDDFDFTCSSGSSLRMVHDMDPNNPTTYNAIPGGYSMNPDDPSFMSEFKRWQEPNPRKIESDKSELEKSADKVTYGPASQ